MKAINIEWDTDGECPIPLILPTMVHIPEGMTDVDEISDWLSDEFGFCHKGFELEKEENLSIDNLIENAAEKQANRSNDSIQRQTAKNDLVH